MTPAWSLTVAWLLASGLFGFVLMGVDKARAIGLEWRIPEKTFVIIALLGGAFGILAASSVFHHKTSKASFMGVVLALTVVWIGVLVYLENVIGSPTA